MIPAALIGKAKSEAKSVLTGDLAVIRYTKPGKGKGKKKKPDKDIELHVNPVSIAVAGTAAAVGVGVAVGLGAIGIYASGLQVTRDSGITDRKTIRLYSKATPDTTTVIHHNAITHVQSVQGHPRGDGTYQSVKPQTIIDQPAYDETIVSKGKGEKWAIYSTKGLPTRLIDGTPTVDNVLSPTDRSKGWQVDTLEQSEDIYVLTLKNPTKRHFGISQRPRGGIKSTIDTLTGGIL